ncbi:Protein of unknown function [Cotesia congregata]|uniref:Uncharacterized protein n=1 Tax=Cotesia congregata TaxID=51543 RepID=A0A8J2MLS7_COTCN|nr:Protein of unknown function [Cotesia congregata]
MSHKNLHDYDSSSTPSNSVVDSPHNSDLEPEVENPENNDNVSDENQIDANNDGQILADSSPIEKPTDISSIITGCRIVDIGYFIKEFT